MTSETKQVTVPADFIEICKEELVRGSLTGLPLKLEFMRNRGMRSLDEVHAWMRETRHAFKTAVEAAQKSES